MERLVACMIILWIDAILIYVKGEFDVVAICAKKGGTVFEFTSFYFFTKNVYLYELEKLYNHQILKNWDY